MADGQGPRSSVMVPRVSNSNMTDDLKSQTGKSGNRTTSLPYNIGPSLTIQEQPELTSEQDGDNERPLIRHPDLAAANNDVKAPENPLALNRRGKGEPIISAAQDDDELKNVYIPMFNKELTKVELKKKEREEREAERKRLQSIKFQGKFAGSAQECSDMML